jgi:Skp family chaperone for outer membrane proteins
MNASRLVGFMVAGALAVLPARAVEVKVAVVDALRLLKEYHKTEIAESHMKEQYEDFTAERDKLLAEHKKLKREFEALRSEANNKALSEEAQDKKKELAEDKISEVIQYEGTIRDKALSRKKQLEGEGRRMQSELIKEIRETIKGYAQKNGYTLVLDSSGLVASGFEAVLYSDEKMDITDAILSLLNADKPKPEGAEKAKPAETEKP